MMAVCETIVWMCSRNQETIGIWYNASVRKYQILLTRSVAVYVATEQKIAFILWSRLRIFPFWTKNRNNIFLLTAFFFSLSLYLLSYISAFCCNALVSVWFGRKKNVPTTTTTTNLRPEYDWMYKNNMFIRFHTFSIYRNWRYIERMQRKRIGQNDCRFIC